MTPPRPSSRGSSAVPTLRLGVDLTDLRNAPRVAREAARATEREVTQGFQRAAGSAETSFNRMDSGARNAARGMGQLRDGSRELANALGIVGGVAGTIQFGRFAIAANQVATAYRRQSVAAVDLAGSQQQLNALLETYDRVTGGAVDRATALSDVTSLMAVGFADSASELARFVRVARGISIATGRPQEFIISQLQLAIANQSMMRLDQLGLSVNEVQERIAELRAENRGLTRELAFQQAILELADQKYGELAESAEGAATGIEEATRAINDARLAFGEMTAPLVDFTGRAFANWLDDAVRDARQLRDFMEQIVFMATLGNVGGIPAQRRARAEAGSFDQAMINRAQAGAASTGPRFTPEQRGLIIERQRRLDQIAEDAGRQRAETTRQFERQRTSIIRDFEQTIARDAEDFARQRARAEREFAAQIVDVREDAARREAEMAEELARANAEAREATDERIADARESAQERLTELEEDYQRNRERATRRHQDNLMSAAARLDARAIVAEQRRFARERVDAAEAREEQREEIQEQLQERIEDEEEALEESNRQRREHYERQLREQREADARRIQEMRADFEERRRIEEEDRAIRLQRLQEDHQDRLDELDRQHGQRIEQIRQQEQEERDRLDEEFQTSLDELGKRTQRWTELQERLAERAIENFDIWWEHVNRQLTGSAFQPPSTGGAARGLPERIPAFQRGGFVPMDTVAFLHAGEFVQPAGAVGQGPQMGDINIAVYGAPDMSPGQFRVLFREELAQALQEAM